MAYDRVQAKSAQGNRKKQSRTVEAWDLFRARTEVLNEVTFLPCRGIRYFRYQAGNEIK